MKSILSRCLKRQSYSGGWGVTSHDLDVTVLTSQKNSGSTVLCAVSWFFFLFTLTKWSECAVETVFMGF